MKLVKEGRDFFCENYSNLLDFVFWHLETSMKLIKEDTDFLRTLVGKVPEWIQMH